MGHPQPPTPVQTDNSMAEGNINVRAQPKQTKVMGMRFHWLCDRSVAQNKFCFYWRARATQLGDYWTKHHKKLMEFRSCQKHGLKGCVKLAKAAQDRPSYFRNL